jgi:hypothetical protein
MSWIQFFRVALYYIFHFSLDFLQLDLYILQYVFSKNTSDLTLRIYKSFSVKYFWVRPILVDLVLQIPLSYHNKYFSEQVRFSGRSISKTVVIFTRKFIEYSLKLRKLKIQFCWVPFDIIFLLVSGLHDYDFCMPACISKCLKCFHNLFNDLKMLNKLNWNGTPFLRFIKSVTRL